MLPLSQYTSVLLLAYIQAFPLAHREGDIGRRAGRVSSGEWSCLERGVERLQATFFVQSLSLHRCFVRPSYKFPTSNSAALDCHKYHCSFDDPRAWLVETFFRVEGWTRCKHHSALRPVFNIFSGLSTVGCLLLVTGQEDHERQCAGRTGRFVWGKSRRLKLM